MFLSNLFLKFYQVNCCLLCIKTKFSFKCYCLSDNDLHVDLKKDIQKTKLNSYYKLHNSISIYSAEHVLH